MEAAMPEPGYGQYEHNKSISLSRRQVDAIEKLQAERGISFAAAARLLIDAGIAAIDFPKRYITGV
jgi:hypothetical protein